MAVAHKQTRRRGAVLLAAIHEATRAELAERGYAGVTFEGVAKRAQVGKTVLYRRYRSRPELVVAAVAEELAIKPLAVSTGSLREDLRRSLRLIVSPSRRLSPATFRALVGEADDELIADLPGMNGDVISVSLRLALTSAQERGELGPAPISDRALSVPAEYLRSISLRREVTSDEIDRLIDEVLLPLYAALADSQS